MRDRYRAAIFISAILQCLAWGEAQAQRAEIKCEKALAVNAPVEVIIPESLVADQARYQFKRNVGVFAIDLDKFRVDLEVRRKACERRREQIEGERAVDLQKNKCGSSAAPRCGEIVAEGARKLVSEYRDFIAWHQTQYNSYRSLVRHLTECTRIIAKFPGF